MVSLYAVRLERELSHNQIEQLMGQVTDARQERTKKYRRQEDQLRSLYGELLILRVLSEKFGVSKDKVEFSVNPYGKPYLAAFPVHYNVTHSGDWVVCAVSELPIGTDVEAVKPIDLSIAERFFSRVESEQLFALSEFDQMDRFYDLWTLKEAYIKWVGKGLSIPINSFSFRYLDNEQTYVLEGLPEDIQKPFCRNIPWEAGYKLAVCSEDRAGVSGAVIQKYDMREWCE